MNSELFETYENDYNSVSSSISRKLHVEIPSQHGEQKKATINSLEKEIQSAEEIVGQMEMELRTLPQNVRAKLQSRLKNYQLDVEKLKKDWKNIVQSSQREELLGDDNEFEGGGSDQRAHLLAGTERLNNVSNRLTETHKIALETEEIGASVLKDLRGQREQIERATRTVREADSNLDRSSRIIRGMARRLATNKLLTTVIILILVATILFVILVKFGII